MIDKKDTREDLLLRLKMKEGRDTTEEKRDKGKSIKEEGGLLHMRKRREDAEGRHHLPLLINRVHHLWDHHLQRNLLISRKKLRKSD